MALGVYRVKENKTERHKTMEICVESFDGEKYTVEVGVDDTTADIRRKVATAAELREDGFDMSFGEKLLAEGDYITQLSAGDTVVLKKKTKSQKDDAIAALRDLGETSLSIGRFEGLEDPTLVHLFLQAEVVTEIPSRFLSGGRFSELDLSGVSGVTATGENFLYGCRSLHTADLSRWSNVTRTEYGFLDRCTALRTLDMSGWNNVTQVDSFFLEGCSSVTTLDLSGWSNVTLIGYSFLQGCSSLTTLDLSGWKSVTQIDSLFLQGCSSLTTLDFSGWNNVTRIGSECIVNCKRLKTLNLSGWTSVQHIGPGFLKGCKIPTSSINVTGSSRVVSEYVKSRSAGKCVCM